MIKHPSPLTAEEIREFVGTSPTMLEIGSHEGADTKHFLETMPGIRLFCFEPEQRALKRFRETIGEDPRVTLYALAIGEADGPHAFWPSTGKAGGRDDWDFSGSLRRPTGHYKYSPEIDFKPVIEVPCLRLDSWFASHPEIETIDFIWCDCQGSQRDILAGGEQAIQHTRFLYIEVHEWPLYDGEPTQPEMVAMMANRGFVPLAIYDINNILFARRA